MRTFTALLPLLPVVLAKQMTKDVLQNGSPESVGLLPDPLKDLENNITAYMTPANYGSSSFNVVHPLFPGATVM